MVAKRHLTELDLAAPRPRVCDEAAGSVTRAAMLITSAQDTGFMRLFTTESTEATEISRRLLRVRLSVALCASVSRW